MHQPPFLSGQLLLAMPGIGDPRFEKAVIAMCVHDGNGALGIGLGRIVPRISFHDLLGQLDIPAGVAPDVALHPGGPPPPRPPPPPAAGPSRSAASSSTRPTGAGRRASRSAIAGP